MVKSGCEVSQDVDERLFIRPQPVWIGSIRSFDTVADVARRFPKIRTQDLEGTVLDLPQALAGDPSIVIVAFERRQQAMVDTWLPWLTGLQTRAPAIAVYEIPTISRRWLPARRLIDGGMRAGIPDPETRRRTLTAYTDVGRVVEALGLEGTGTIAIVVVERGGAILWQGAGSYDSGLAAELERTLPANQPAGETA